MSVEASPFRHGTPSLPCVAVAESSFLFTCVALLSSHVFVWGGAEIGQTLFLKSCCCFLLLLESATKFMDRIRALVEATEHW